LFSTGFSASLHVLQLVFGPRLSGIVQNFYYSLLYTGGSYIDAQAPVDAAGRASTSSLGYVYNNPPAVVIPVTGLHQESAIVALYLIRGLEVYPLASNRAWNCT
jgi:hypothetical protein